MSDANLVSRICAYVEKSNQWGVPVETPLPNLGIYAAKEPTELACFTYDAVVCLILQGRKETLVGSRTLDYGEGASLIVSHDMHVHARITEAHPITPYVALVLKIDVDIVRELKDQLSANDDAERTAAAFEVGTTDPALLDAMDRYVALLHDTADASVLGPLILRELHYRILTAPHGGMVRKLVRRNSPESRISRAINRIREEFSKSITVGELADTAGMSASSFHEHFKAITETTPLQFQKDLRLMEARRLIQEDGQPVSTAAYEVGYESPTQFSREYSRKFGIPPSKDHPLAMTTA